MKTRRDFVDHVAELLSQRQSVVVRGAAGMGKTTMVRAVLAHPLLTDVSIRRAAASVTAQKFSFGALANILPVESAGSDTAAMMSLGIASLRRSKPRQLLVVDDAQVLDDESAALVHHIRVEDVATVLATVRSTDGVPDAVRRITVDGLAEVLDLPGMSDEELLDVAERHLGGVVDRPTARLLCAASEGNPLLLRELLVASQAAELLEHRFGAWSASELMDGATARELMRSRVTAWNPHIQEVARLFAVGGAMPLRIAITVAGRTKVLEARSAGALVERDDNALFDLSHPVLAETVRSGVSPSGVVDILRLLVAASATDPPGTADLVVPRSVWLLELGDRQAGDAAALIAAAARSVDIARGDLAERFAEAAIAAGGGEVAQQLLIRARAFAGRAQSESTTSNGATQPGTAQSDVMQRFQDALGRTEAFILGLVPFDGLLTLLAEVRYALGERPERFEVEAHELGVMLRTGASPASICDRLQPITRRRDHTNSAVTATQMFGHALIETGGMDAALAAIDHFEDGEIPANVFHRIHLGLIRAQCHMFSGRPVEAKEAVRLRVWNGPGSDSQMAMVLGGSVEAEIALFEGRPVDAIRSLSALLAVVGELDSAGLGSWGRAAMLHASAWAGMPVEIAAAPIPIPPHGRNLWAQIELCTCNALAAAGEVREARDRVLALADRAEGDGRFMIALMAIHVAARVKPTPELAQRASTLAAQCDGDLAAVIARHCHCLVSRRASELAISAEELETAGQLALAREAYAWAAEQYRTEGVRAAATRCRAAAQRLEASGVAASFAMPPSPAAHQLTRREREIAEIAIHGATNRVIAQQLGLSARTVETHLQNAYRKTGTSDRVTLAAALHPNTG